MSNAYAAKVAYEESANFDPVPRSRLQGPIDGREVAEELLKREREHTERLLEEINLARARRGEKPVPIHRPAADNGERRRGTDIGAHYKFAYKGVKLDPYRIFKVYGITDPAQQHLIKKGLRAGQSVKELKQDIREIISTAQRWLEMLEEDAA